MKENEKKLIKRLERLIDRLR